jgi:hypothetical protein
VQVTHPAPGRLPALDEEAAQRLVDLDDVVRVAGLGEHDVAGLHVVL